MTPTWIAWAAWRRSFAERCTGGYHISLDGNEQYRDLADLERLIEALALARARCGVRRRDPLYRTAARPRLGARRFGVGAGIRQLSQVKPVIIDESDDLPTSFARAIELGYSGTSHKNCKGIFKSLRNRALARGEESRVRRGNVLFSRQKTWRTPP